MWNLVLTWKAFLVFLFLAASMAIFFYSWCYKSNILRSVLISLTVTGTVILYTTIYFIVRWLGASLSLSAVILYSAATALWILSLSWFVVNKNASFRKLYGYLIGFLRWRNISVISVFFLYLIILSNYLFRNGYNADGDLVMTNMFSTEVMWHLTIIHGLKYDILPQTLHYESTDVSSYHYFPNLFLQMISQLSGVEDVFILFVYFFVPIMLLILAINIFTLAKLLWNHFSIALLTMIVSLFCYDLSAPILWLRAVILEQHLWFGSSTPDYLSVWSPLISFFQLFYNPSYLFSTALFLGVSVILMRWIKEKSVWLFSLAIIGVVFLFKAKITAFLVCISGLGVIAVYHGWMKKNYSTLFLFLFVMLLSYPLYSISGGQKKNKVEFSQWYFPANFAERAHFISNSERKELHHRILPSDTIATLRFIIAFFIYYFGLFHFRLLGLMYLLQLKKMMAWIQTHSIHLFFMACVVSGIGAFVFVVNALAKYDSHWFYSLIVFILNIYVVRILYEWFQMKNRFRQWFAVLSSMVLALTMTSFLIPVLQNRWMSQTMIPRAEMDAYRFISTLSPETRVMTKYFDLFEPNDEKHQFLMALSGKKVVREGVNYVFEYRAQDSLYHAKQQQIRNDVERFYSTDQVSEALAIMNRYQADYVFRRKNDPLHFNANDFFEEVFSNDKVQILKKIF